MSYVTSTRQDDLDFRVVWQALSAAKWKLLLFVLAAGLLSFAVVSVMAPTYRSEARILLERGENTFRRPASTQAVTDTGAPIDKVTISSQIAVLTSTDLMRQVAKKLDLAKNPAFNPALKDPGLVSRLLILFGFKQDPRKLTEEERILRVLEDMISVYQVENSRVIAISVTAKDPKIAPRIANALAEAYIDWQRKDRLSQTIGATEWLAAQIADLRRKVAEAEAAVEKFRAETGLVAGSNDVTLDTQQLSELNSQLILAKARRSEAEARAKLIRDMLERRGDVNASPDVLKSPVIQRLLEQKVQLQRRYAELSANFRPSHPRLKRLRAEMAGLNRQIRQEARKIVASLENEAKIAAARERSLKESLDKLKSLRGRNSADLVKLRALEREAKAARQLLESYLARYQDASRRRDETAVPPLATIISRATVSNVPNFPKKGPMVLLAMLGAAVLGVGLIVTRSILLGTAPMSSPTPQSNGGMSEAFYPAPAARPALPERAPPSPILSASPQDRLTALGGTLQNLARGREANLVLLVAGSPEKDDATAAVALAREVARRGVSAILVDVSTRPNALAAVLGLPDSPGYGELLVGRTTFEETVRRDMESSLQFMAAGMRDKGDAPDTAPVAQRILEALSAIYDMVFIYVDGAQAETLASQWQGRVLAAVFVSASDQETGTGAQTDLADNLAQDMDVFHLAADRGHETGARAPGTNSPRPQKNAMS